jgi:hypothetical protein
MKYEDTIHAWIVETITNPQQHAAVHKDPAGAIKASKLTQAQKDVLLSRDPRRIAHVVEYELGIAPAVGGGTMHLVVAAVAGTHGVPPPPPPPGS